MGIAGGRDWPPNRRVWVQHSEEEAGGLALSGGWAFHFVLSFGCGPAINRIASAHALARSESSAS